jgi:hypothetical protein
MNRARLLVVVAVAVALAVAPPSWAASRLGLTGTLTDRYLTVSEVRDELHGSNDRLQECFLEHVAAVMPGEMTLSFVVRRDGHTEEVFVEVAESFEELRICVVEHVGKVRFQEHDGDPLEVAYPLVFHRDENGSRLVKYPIVFVRPRPRAFLLIPVPLALTPEERELLSGWLYP